MDLYRNFLNSPNYFAHNDDLQLDDDFEDQETENLRRTAIRDRQNPLESLQDRQFRYEGIYITVARWQIFKFWNLCDV